MAQTKLIANGTVVTAEGEFDGDVLIDGEKIAAVGHVAAPDGTEVIDAAGCFVLPGLIDNHTHLSMPFMGTMSSDDYDTGTQAAAAGGVTCLVDFAIQQQPDNLQSTLEEWRGRADGAAHVDYGFHMAITNASEPVLDDMTAMSEAGVCSFKLFMAYKGALMVRDDELAACMERARDLDALTMVHAENGDIIDLLVKRALARGDTSAINHALTRPEFVEAEATGRAARIAEHVGAPLFVVHVTCAAAAAEIEAAQQRGAPVTGETCVQYLINSIDDLRRPGVEGCRYICSPPLRDGSNHEPLWGYLRRGVLESVSTDHCPFNDEQKSRGLDDFSLVPNGLAPDPAPSGEAVGRGRRDGPDHPLAARRPYEHDDRPTVRPARQGGARAGEGRRRRRARPGGTASVRQGDVVHERRLRPVRGRDRERERSPHVLERARSSTTGARSRPSPGTAASFRGRSDALARPSRERAYGSTRKRSSPTSTSWRRRAADGSPAPSGWPGRRSGCEARAWLTAKLAESGLEPERDEAGNLWAPHRRRARRVPDRRVAHRRRARRRLARRRARADDRARDGAPAEPLRRHAADRRPLRRLGRRGGGAVRAKPGRVLGVRTQPGPDDVRGLRGLPVVSRWPTRLAACGIDLDGASRRGAGGWTGPSRISSCTSSRARCSSTAPAWRLR